MTHLSIDNRLAHTMDYTSIDKDVLAVTSIDKDVLAVTSIDKDVLAVKSVKLNVDTKRMI
jgi:hypothetical protein